MRQPVKRGSAWIIRYSYEYGLNASSSQNYIQAVILADGETVNMILVGTYNLYLVVLSIAVASLASYTALDLGGRIMVFDMNIAPFEILAIDSFA